jgi:hypothetical protein
MTNNPISKLLRRILRMQTVYLYAAEPFKTVERVSPGERLLRVDIEQFDRWAASQVEVPWSRDIVLKRLQSGAYFYALVVDAIPVSFIWASWLEQYELGEISLNCIFQSEACWYWDAVTPSAHRCKGYYRRLLQALLDEFSDSTRIFFAMDYNTPSIKGIEGAGISKWLTVHRSRLGFWVRYFDRSLGELRLVKSD